MSEPRRLVLDTNVVLDCFGFADPRSSTLVAHLDSGAAALLFTAALREELARVLGYPGLPFDGALRAHVLARYDGLARPVSAAAGYFALPRCRDQDDQKFLEAARDGGADFLVTKDKALLKLARGTSAAKRFAIVTPEEYAVRTQRGATRPVQPSAA